MTNGALTPIPIVPAEGHLTLRAGGAQGRDVLREADLVPEGCTNCNHGSKGGGDRAAKSARRSPLPGAGEVSGPYGMPSLRCGFGLFAPEWAMNGLS